MPEFEDRERAAEKKFTLDQEQEFKAQARRARLLGDWVAAELGLAGEAADSYAKSLVIADLAEKGEEDVYRKVKADLDAGGKAHGEREIRAKMAALLAQARAQIAAAS